MSTPDSGDVASAVAAVVAEMSEALAPVEEAARGYRERLKRDHGWNDNSAQEIATAYFKTMIHILARNV